MKKIIALRLVIVIFLASFLFLESVLAETIISGDPLSGLDIRLQVANVLSVPVATESENINFIPAQEIINGKIFKVTTDKKIQIALPNGKIDLQEGTILKNVNKNQWDLLSGSIHLLIDSRKNQIIKITSDKNTISLKGGELLISKNSGSSMVVQVIRGSVSVISAGKKKTLVPAKGATVSDWYKNIPSSPSFLYSGWKNIIFADNYTDECVTTKPTIISSSTLIVTSSQKVVLNKFNEISESFGSLVFKKEVSSKQKIISVKKEQITGDGKKVWNFYVNNNEVYFPVNDITTWHKIKNNNLGKVLLSSIKNDGADQVIDWSSLKFDKWQQVGNKRIAIFSGHASDVGNQYVVSDFGYLKFLYLGSTMSGIQPLFDVKVSFDEETGRLVNYEVLANIVGDQKTITFNKICKYSYNDKIKIKLPDKAKTVEIKTGQKELYKFTSNPPEDSATKKVNQAVKGLIKKEIKNIF